MADDKSDRAREPEAYEDEAPRSLFARAWFRGVAVVVALGAVAAVAVPYVLDWMNPPSPVPVAVVRPAIPPSPAPTPPSAASPAKPSPAPTAPSSAASQAKPASEAKAAAEARTVADAKPSKPGTVPAGGEAAKAAAKDEPAKKAPAEPKRAPAPKPRPAATKASGSERGAYWVQVGAFKDLETAKRVAAGLREQNYRVEESTTQPQAGVAGPASPDPGGVDRYDVMVSGGSTAEISARLTAKGLAAEATTGGSVAIKPSLPLRDAVALSKDLAAEGFKVQVRRAVSARAAEPPPPAGGGETLHRVRVGGFPDRASAVVALRELEAKGYKPFIARGRE